MSHPGCGRTNPLLDCKENWKRECWFEAGKRPACCCAPSRCYRKRNELEFIARLRESDCGRALCNGCSVLVVGPPLRKRFLSSLGAPPEQKTGVHRLEVSAACQGRPCTPDFCLQEVVPVQMWKAVIVTANSTLCSAVPNISLTLRFSVRCLKKLFTCFVEWALDLAMLHWDLVQDV